MPSGNSGMSIGDSLPDAAYHSCSLTEDESANPEKVLELCRLAMMPKISLSILKCAGSQSVVLTGVVVIVSDALIFRCKVM